MAYVFQEYPKTLYDGFDGTTVESAEEEAALGDGYTPFPVDPDAEPPVVTETPRRGRPRKVVEA